MGYQQLADQLLKNMDLTPEQVAPIEQFIAGLKEGDIERKALKKGDVMPSFSLPNADGKVIDSNELLKKGPLVITFYRGGWCSFCNLALRSLQMHLAEIQSFNATLIAITPERPTSSENDNKDKSVDFEILTDHDNKLAKKLGLVFELSENMRKIYQSFNIDVSERNNSKAHELPIPATYVINFKGIVTYAFIDANYQKRAEPQDIINTLKQRL